MYFFHGVWIVTEYSGVLIVATSVLPLIDQWFIRSVTLSMYCMSPAFWRSIINTPLSKWWSPNCIYIARSVGMVWPSIWLETLSPPYNTGTLKWTEMNEQTNEKKDIKKQHVDFFYSKRASVELVQWFPVLTPWLRIGRKTWNWCVPRAKEFIPAPSKWQLHLAIPATGCLRHTLPRAQCAQRFCLKHRITFVPRETGSEDTTSSMQCNRGSWPVAATLAATPLLLVHTLLWSREAVQWRLGSSSCQWGQSWVHQRGRRKKLVPANHHVGQVQVV